MFDRILMTTDLSEVSWSALPLARRLSQTFEASLKIVTVVDEPYFFAAHSYPADALPQWNKEYFEKTSSFAQECIKERLAAAEVQASTEIRRSPNVADELVQAAKENPNALIVMSTHGRVGLSGMMIGSTAERVVRLSTVPVLTVRADAEPRDVQRILFTTDLSRESWSAFPVAVELAKRMSCRMTVLCVMDDDYYLKQHGLLAAWEEALQDRQPKVEATLKEKLKSIPLGKDFEVQIEDNASASKTIIELAEPSDIVVMATHGRSGFRRWMLGSTTEKVVRASPAPVMTVHCGTTE